MFGNTGGSLGEREVLWERKSIGKCFHSFFEVSQTFTMTRIETRRT